jgi:internalin A
MNAYADHAVSYLFTQSWQIALLAGMVGLLSLALRNRSAHLRYLLWLLVLAKCLAPPLVSIPLAVLPEGPLPSPSPARLSLPQEHAAPQMPLPAAGVTQPQGTPPASISVQELLALVWCAGVFLFLLWIGVRAVRYTTWLRARRRPLPPAPQECIRELAANFRFRRPPKVWLLDDIAQPFIWGLLRGSVYLPADFAGFSDADQRRSILAHELSHIARFDAGINLLQVLTQAAYWFHPLVWWANRKTRQEREKCCDEMVLAHLQTPPEHYTGAIVDALAAERRLAHPIPSLAIVGSIRDIEERINTMLKPGKTFRRRPSLCAAAIALLLALVTIPTALVLTARGQAPPVPQSVGQPRYAARSFNSGLAFDVFVLEELDWSWRGMFGRRVGRTPSATPLEIPACWVWWVQPAVPVEDWDALAREIRGNNIPGLAWGAADEANMRHLAGLAGLQFLRVGATDTSLAHFDTSMAHLGGLTELWGLDLSSAQISGSGLEHLRGLPKLEYLSLMSTPVTDAGLQHLREMKKLRLVNLCNTQITNAGLEQLRALTGLQALNLNTTRITGAGLGLLQNLSGLQKLHVRNLPITDADLIFLRGLTELRSLDFVATTGFTGSGLACLKGLTKLRDLNLCHTGVTDSGLAHLAGLTGLRMLSLDDTPVTDAGLAHLRGLTGLEILGLPLTQITDVTLADLVRNQAGLRQLQLSDTQITDAGLAHLAGLTQLATLHLCRTQITEAGLAYLQGLSGLKVLNLYGTNITDAGLEQLQNLTGLELLVLSNTQITDAGLEYLQGLSELSNLYLANTPITDTGLAPLKGLKRLSIIDLAGTQVTGWGVQQLKQSLPSLSVRQGEGMEEWLKAG